MRETLQPSGSGFLSVVGWGLGGIGSNTGLRFGYKKLWKRTILFYEGRTMKQCSKCKGMKSLDDFYNNKRSSDGKTKQCKSCLYKQPRWKGRTKYGEYDPALLRMAMSKWEGIVKRCNPRQQKKCYRGVENRFNKEQFIRWVIPELERFYKEQPYETASIDRIDPTGHYEPGNVRVISHLENSRRNRRNPAYRKMVEDGHPEGIPTSAA